MDLLLLAARILFGGFFIYKGARHFMHPANQTDDAGFFGIPLPGILWGLKGMTLVLGGLCFVFGYHPFYGLAWVGSAFSHNAFAVASTPGVSGIRSALPHSGARN
jgi:uncharacterized membrane protein YphA (DoxX/SURF4 family)